MIIFADFFFPVIAVAHIVIRSIRDWNIGLEIIMWLLTSKRGYFIRPQLGRGPLIIRKSFLGFTACFTDPHGLLLR